MIRHDVCDDRFLHSKTATQSHKYHDDRFAPVLEVINQTTSTNTIMMIPEILRNLFDIEYLLCPSVSTDSNLTKTADLVSTVKNNIEFTPSIPVQQTTNKVSIRKSTASLLMSDYSPNIIKPSIDCTPTTIETMTTTDDDNDDDDDDYDTSEAEHQNFTTPSNTNRLSFNDSSSAPTTTLLMAVTSSPDSVIQIGEDPMSSSKNHAYNARSVIGAARRHIPLSFPKEDITAPVVRNDGNRRSIATRLLFFPIQHHKILKTKSAVPVTSPADISKPVDDAKVERRRRLLRREKRHRKTTTADVVEIPTSTTQMGSNRSTVNEIMIDDTETTDISTMEDDDLFRIISKLRQQLQSMDQQLQSITVLHDSTIDNLSPKNDGKLNSNLGIAFNQHLESIQHLITGIQQDMTTIMNPVVATNDYEVVDVTSVEQRALATTSSAIPMVNDNVSPPPTPSYNMNNFFIRVQDLDIECLPHDVSISSSLSSLSTISTSFHKSSSPLNYDNKFYFHVTNPSKLGMILERLVQYGYRTILQPNDKNDSVDNIDFQPTRDTQRLIQHQQKHGLSCDDEMNRCHIYTWIGTKDKNRTCNTDISDTFGNTWPITKVRAIIPNVTPLQLITFIFDSAQVPKYNNISLGRDDLMTWHYDNYENNASSSNNVSLIGTVKIVRGRVQPKLFPKVIETLCIMYITSIPGELDSYMIVSRSILEDETWGNQTAAMIVTPPNSNNSTQTATATIRSEMLLNVYYVRPMKQQGHYRLHSVDGTSCCELTLVTHVVSPGVPEIFAKRMAPMTAMTMVREIQSIFSAK